ncbi:MAG: chemotaxis protein CheD [Promethearchaeota archaeon]
MAIAKTIIKQKNGKKKYIVGIAEIAIASENNYLMIIGLGSCIGTIIWDKEKKIGGLIHTILPIRSKMAPSRATPKTKFADTGIPILIEKLLKEGAKKRNLIAKIAGGSQMFALSTMQIGKNNAKAAKKALLLQKIPLLSEDILGTHGRTIIFDTTTGIMVIRRGTKEIIRI